MLESIKNKIQNGIAVELGEVNRFDQYPLHVTDVTESSITKGWSLTYYPRLITKNRTRFYDGKEAFTALHITNFRSLHDALFAIDQRFTNGESVETGHNGLLQAVYELNGARFSVVQYEKSRSINLTITHEISPFYMLQLSMKIVDDQKAPGKRHLIGSDSQWDLNTDTFLENYASMSPKKERMLKVHQEGANSVPYIRAASRPGIQPNTTEIDPETKTFEYVQDVGNKYKALAVIVEQTIIEVAMERAMEIYNKKNQQSTTQEQPAFNHNQAPAFGGGSSFNNQQSNQQQSHNFSAAPNNAF